MKRSPDHTGRPLVHPSVGTALCQTRKLSRVQFKVSVSNGTTLSAIFSLLVKSEARSVVAIQAFPGIASLRSPGNGGISPTFNCTLPYPAAIGKFDPAVLDGERYDQRRTHVQMTSEETVRAAWNPRARARPSCCLRRCSADPSSWPGQQASDRWRELEDET